MHIYIYICIYIYIYVYTFIVNAVLLAVSVTFRTTGQGALPFDRQRCPGGSDLQRPGTLPVDVGGGPKAGRVPADALLVAGGSGDMFGIRKKRERAGPGASAGCICNI